MSGSDGYSVNYPALDGVRQALEATHANLNVAVVQTAPGCTVAADAYPAWSTSAAVRNLHLECSTNISSQADDIARYAAGVGGSIVSYGTADQTTRGNVTRVYRALNM